METGRVPVTPPGLEAGRTMRWVERFGVPGRGGGGGREGPPAGRGMTIGWVVAAPVAIPPLGNKPESWGGFPPDTVPGTGGV
jgi:hypothetical protein